VQERLKARWISEFRGILSKIIKIIIKQQVLNSGFN